MILSLSTENVACQNVRTDPADFTQTLQALVKDILEAAYDSGAEMLVTPCAMCQMNTEAFQDDINKTYGTNFNMPVVYYSQMMAVAYGKSAKEAGLDQQIIRATKLEEIAAK